MHMQSLSQIWQFPPFMEYNAAMGTGSAYRWCVGLVGLGLVYMAVTSRPRPGRVESSSGPSALTLVVEGQVEGPGEGPLTVDVHFARLPLDASGTVGVAANGSYHYGAKIKLGLSQSLPTECEVVLRRSGCEPGRFKGLVMQGEPLTVRLAPWKPQKRSVLALAEKSAPIQRSGLSPSEERAFAVKGQAAALVGRNFQRRFQMPGPGYRKDWSNTVEIHGGHIH